MDFKLSDDQQMIREAAATFAQEQLKNQSHEMEEDQEAIEALLRATGELGFLGMCLPENYGGIGADTVSFALAVEEISKANASMGSFLVVNNALVGEMILQYGSDEVKKLWLEQLATGKSLGAHVSSHSPTEGITVHIEGGGYRLSGHKQIVMGGGLADVFLIDAGVITTNDDIQQRALLLVPGDTSGLITGPKQRTMGLRAAAITSIECLDCIIPEEHLLGDFGRGGTRFDTVAGFADIGVAAQALGLAETAYSVGLEYAEQRKQFGQPISRFQSISYMLAEMQTAIETTRHSIYYAAWLRDQGQAHRISAAQARWRAVSVANQVANTALQIHGGAGYIREYPVEGYLRDARMLGVIDGSADAQKQTIAEGLLD